MTDTVIIPKDIDSVFCFLDNTGLSIEPTEHIYILSFCFYFLNYVSMKIRDHVAWKQSLWHNFQDSLETEPLRSSGTLQPVSFAVTLPHRS